MKKYFPLLIALLLFAGASRSYGFAVYFSSYGSMRTVYATGYPPEYARAVAPTSYASASLVKASRIAYQHAYPHSRGVCWKFVKNALLAAGAVSSRPTSSYAFQAAGELTGRYGFIDTGLRNPYSAPVGAVIVYGGHGSGHVELRTERGFASDYRSPYRCAYSHVIGIYVKAPRVELASAN